MSLYTKENSDYLVNNRSWHVEDSVWKARQILRMVSNNNLKVNTVCEIGCGAGEILNQLAKSDLLSHCQFSGYDISIDAHNISISREKENLKFFHEDYFQKEVFDDLLLIIDVFEHVPDYISFISATKNRSTYKIFHIPLDMNVLGILRNSPMRDRKKLGHLHYFSKDTALATISDCGLDILDYFYTPAIEVDNKTLNQKILNPIRRACYMINPDLTVKTLSGYSLLVLAK